MIDATRDSRSRREFGHWELPAGASAAVRVTARAGGAWFDWAWSWRLAQEVATAVRRLCSALALCMVAGVSCPAADLFVASNGDDRWSGGLPAPNAGRTDGPFATLERAQAAARDLLQRQMPGLVQVLDGAHSPQALGGRALAAIPAHQVAGQRTVRGLERCYLVSLPAGVVRANSTDRRQ